MKNIKKIMYNVQCTIYMSMKEDDIGEIHKKDINHGQVKY